MKKFVAVVFIALALASSAHAETRKFSVTASTNKASERPKAKSIGDLIVNGTVRVPAYALTVVDGYSEEGWTELKPESMQVRGKLSADAAKQLQAYFTKEGWVLVPRGWNAVYGGIGANGTSRFEFAPASGVGKVTFYDSGGGCVGCALVDASLFFENARNQARENEFPITDRTSVPVSKVKLRPTLVGYRATVSGQQLDGIDGFYDGQLVEYFNQEVVLPRALRHLATPILNWTMSQRN